MGGVLLPGGLAIARLAVLGREVEVDRHRLEKLELAVHQGRHLAVRIDLEKVGILEILHLDGDVLVRDAEFMRDPEGARRARGRRPVNLDGHETSPQTTIARTIVQRVTPV